MVSTASQVSVPALRLSASGRSKRHFWGGTRGKEPNTDSQYNDRVLEVIPQPSPAGIDHPKRKTEQDRSAKADSEARKNVGEKDSDTNTEDRRGRDGKGDISARSGYREVLSRESNECRSSGACHKSVVCGCDAAGEAGSDFSETDTKRDGVRVTSASFAVSATNVAPIAAIAHPGMHEPRTP